MYCTKALCLFVIYEKIGGEENKSKIVVHYDHYELLANNVQHVILLTHQISSKDLGTVYSMT